MELFKKKNVELINQMVSECQSRIDSAKAEINQGKYDTAKSSLYAVTTLLESLQTLDKGSKWASDN